MWQLVKYKSGWAIYDTVTRCYVVFGPKARLEKRIKELNQSK